MLNQAMKASKRSTTSQAAASRYLRKLKKVIPLLKSPPHIRLHAFAARNLLRCDVDRPGTSKKLLVSQHGFDNKRNATQRNKTKPFIDRSIFGEQKTQIWWSMLRNFTSSSFDAGLRSSWNISYLFFRCLGLNLCHRSQKQRKSLHKEKNRNNCCESPTTPWIRRTKKKRVQILFPLYRSLQQ